MRAAAAAFSGWLDGGDLHGHAEVVVHIRHGGSGYFHYRIYHSTMTNEKARKKDTFGGHLKPAPKTLHSSLHP